MVGHRGMILHVIRSRFVDRWWTGGDLDTAAEFWLRLYEAAAHSQGFADTPTHRTEIRLRGFPRSRADTLLREVASRVADSDFPAPEADLPDLDTLVLASGEIHGAEQAPAGLGFPILLAPAFEGLMVEFRFEVRADERKTLRKVQLESTLVLVGELRAGQFLLKTAWRAGSHGWEDRLLWHAPWPDEEAWFHALDAYRESEEVPAALAKKLFISRGADRTGNLAVKLIHVPLDAPRLGGLLSRFAFFSALLGAIGLGAWWSYQEKNWLLLTFAAFASGPLLLLFFFFLRNEWRLWELGFRRFRAAYGKLYSEATRHIALKRVEADAVLENPWTRKYTADLESAGFRYAGDIRLESTHAVGQGIFRAFFGLDGCSYLTVFFHLATPEDQDPHFKNWPAAVAFLGHTFFADGGYVTCVSGRSVGYRKKRTGPEHLMQIFPDVDDPVEFARLHAVTAARFGRDTSRRSLPHQPFDYYLRKLGELSDEERRLFVDHPYSRGDHLHWYLQSIRSTYRCHSNATDPVSRH